MIGSIYATCLKSASDSDCIYSSHTNAREQEQVKGACTIFTGNLRVCKPRFSQHGYFPFETSYIISIANAWFKQIGKLDKGGWYIIWNVRCSPLERMYKRLL